ncbi:hypothetical protein EVAR_21334_1 [Eumeta japonica]|uniref:Uncharacterized protein n=1 Tax=Eumeta variegata TaxID=151549 RepID=A0A4C1ZP20_EUMVA|nr:hypothetical protein EVAR_21334_1 [Eumeta japonica]
MNTITKFIRVDYPSPRDWILSSQTKVTAARAKNSPYTRRLLFSYKYKCRRKECARGDPGSRPSRVYGALEFNVTQFWRTPRRPTLTLAYAMHSQRSRERVVTRNESIVDGTYTKTGHPRSRRCVGLDRSSGTSSAEGSCRRSAKRESRYSIIFASANRSRKFVTRIQTLGRSVGASTDERPRSIGSLRPPERYLKLDNARRISLDSRSLTKQKYRGIFFITGIVTEVNRRRDVRGRRREAARGRPAHGLDDFLRSICLLCAYKVLLLSAKTPLRYRKSSTVQNLLGFTSLRTLESRVLIKSNGVARVPDQNSSRARFEGGPRRRRRRCGRRSRAVGPPSSRTVRYFSRHPLFYVSRRSVRTRRGKKLKSSSTRVQNTQYVDRVVPRNGSFDRNRDAARTAHVAGGTSDLSLHVAASAARSGTELWWLPRRRRGG